MTTATAVKKRRRKEANGYRCPLCSRVIASGAEGYHSPPCYCGASDHAACNRPHV